MEEITLPIHLLGLETDMINSDLVRISEMHLATVGRIFYFFLDDIEVIGYNWVRRPGDNLAAINDAEVALKMAPDKSQNRVLPLIRSEFVQNPLIYRKDSVMQIIKLTTLMRIDSLLSLSFHISDACILLPSNPFVMG